MGCLEYKMLLSIDQFPLTLGWLTPEQENDPALLLRNHGDSGIRELLPAFTVM